MIEDPFHFEKFLTKKTHAYHPYLQEEMMDAWHIMIAMGKIRTLST